MDRRTLSLKREELTALTTSELNAVVGGTHAGCATGDCLPDVVTVKSVNAPCETVPDYYCLTIDGPRCIT